MKKQNRFRQAGGALLAAALIGLTPSASALVLTYEDTLSGHAIGTPFTGGGFRINLQDFDMGTLYPSSAVGTATGFGANGTGTQTVAGGIATLNTFQSDAATGANPVGGEDTWGIARILTITDLAGSVIWSETNKNAQLTVMFYGEQDFYVSQLAGGFQNIDGVGLHADLYFQSKSDADYTAYNPLLGSAGRTGVSSYTTVTDGINVLDTISTSGFIHGPGVLGGPSTEFNSTYNNTSGGQGQAYLSVVGGVDAAQFNTNGFDAPFNANTADLFAQFTTIALGSGTPNPAIADWLVSSNDPIRGSVAGVPDAGSTLLMFGLGLGFLAAAYRRRR